MTGERGFWTYVRRAVLAASVLASAVFLLRSGVPTVCKDAVAESRVVRICEPMGATDVRVLAVALVLGALLVPDVSELGVGGVITLKRAVAEARTEAAEAKAEVAQLRLATIASSTAKATAAGNVVNIGHDFVTALARLNADEQRPPTPEPAGSGGATTPGAFAAAAFRAGFEGLLSVLPDWADDVGLIGYGLDTTGRFEPQISLYASEGEVLDTTRLLQEHLGSRLLDLQHTRWLACAEVCDDAERRIGALAVLVRRPRVDAGPSGEPGSDAEYEELLGAVEVAAGAYTRLRLDLLDGGAPNADNAPMKEDHG